jgi:hypothetical protein
MFLLEEFVDEFRERCSHCLKDVWNIFVAPRLKAWIVRQVTQALRPSSVARSAPCCSPKKLARFGGHLFAHCSQLDDMAAVLCSQKNRVMELFYRKRNEVGFLLWSREGVTPAAETRRFYRASDRSRGTDNRASLKELLPGGCVSDAGNNALFLAFPYAIDLPRLAGLFS